MPTKNDAHAAQGTARSMSNAEWVMVLALSVIWGGSFLFIGIAVKEVPVFTIVAARVVIAALALHIVLRVSGIPFPLTAPALLAFLGMGLLNNILPFNLIVFGQSQIDSGLASILNATTPIFTMIFAHFLTSDEKIGYRKGIGIVLGFLGVIILFSGRDLMSKAAVLGQFACIAASMSYGFAGIFGRRFAALKIQPVTMAAGQLTMSALLMLPLALIVERPFAGPAPSLYAIGAIVLMALVSTAGGYVLFFRILSRAGATNVSLVTLLIPCSAILFGSLILGEALGAREIGGFVVIALGLLVIDGRFLGGFRQKSAGP